MATNLPPLTTKEKEDLQHVQEILDKWRQDFRDKTVSKETKQKRVKAIVQAQLLLEKKRKANDMKSLIEILDRENLTDNQIGLLVADILVGDIPASKYTDLIEKAKQDSSLKRVADNAIKVLNRANGQ